MKTMKAWIKMIVCMVLMTTLLLSGCRSEQENTTSPNEATSEALESAVNAANEADVVDYHTDDETIVEISQTEASSIINVTGGNRIIAVAVSQVGRGPNGVGKELKRYPYNLGRYLYSGEAWCSEFVSWVYKVAGSPFTDGKEGGWMLKSTTRIKDWFLSKRTFITRRNNQWWRFQPNPGDYIRYNTASGGHSGIVRYVSGSTLYTVEGNVGNQVVLRTINNWRNRVDIDGIGQR